MRARESQRPVHANQKTQWKVPESNMPISDRGGQMLMTKEQQLKRWVEHFTDLLNRPAPEEQPNISQAEVDLPISVELQSKEEIKKAIRTLKNGKAAGPDGIPAEALKADIFFFYGGSLMDVASKTA